MSISVLIADDDRLIRAMIIEALKGIGVDDVTEAVDGNQALSCFELNEFGLIVLDWEMPGKNGLEVLRAIRATGSKVPILMASATAKKDRVVEAIQAGATDYLAKPFKQDAMQKRLRKYCPIGKIRDSVDAYRANHVMNTKIVTIRDNASVADAIALLLEHSISGLPVVDAQDKLVGIITEHQLVRSIYRPEITDRKVSDLMTKDVITVEEDALLSSVATMMETQRCRRLPVVRGDRLVGIIARRDLLRYFTENEELLSDFLGSIRAAMGG